MGIRDNGKWFALFYMLGFFVGILYTNIVSKDYVAAMGIFNEYFLNQYMQTDIVEQEYMWYILRVRVVPIAMVAVLGTLKIRKGVVIAFLLWTGLLSGMLFTSSVMKMGIKGIILCLVSVIPQFVFYLIGYVILLWQLYAYPKTRWNLSKIAVVILAVGVGMILECYVNPVLVKMFLKTV